MKYLRMLAITLTIQCFAVGNAGAAETPSQKVYENERVVTEANGSQTRLVRWAS